jgi:hypothetical protein
MGNMIQTEAEYIAEMMAAKIAAGVEVAELDPSAVLVSRIGDTVFDPPIPAAAADAVPADAVAYDFVTRQFILDDDGYRAMRAAGHDYSLVFVVPMEVQ